MVENEIVLKSSCLERTGLAQKLAWKIGKIKHEPSEDNKDNREKKIIYHRDWEKCETENVLRRTKNKGSYELNINELRLFRGEGGCFLCYEIY